MVKNPNNKGYYSEEFDIERLNELREMAERYVKKENFKDKGVFSQDIPDAHFSDLECNVWELFAKAFRNGYYYAFWTLMHK